MTKTKKLIVTLCTFLAVLFVSVALFGGFAGGEVSASALTTDRRVISNDIIPLYNNSSLSNNNRRHYSQGYATMDEAAIAWGKEYAAKSIRENREYGSIIYKYSDGKYYYHYAYRGTRNSCYPNGETDKYRVAVIHSHGKAEWDKGEEFFSGADYSVTLSFGLKTVYVTTPEGKLLRGNAFGEKYHGSWWGNAFAAFTTPFTTKTVNSDMPHDKGAIWQAIKFKHWGKKRCAKCA